MLDMVLVYNSKRVALHLKQLLFPAKVFLQFINDFISCWNGIKYTAKI